MCKMCDYVSSHKHNLKDHIRIVHNSDKKLKDMSKQELSRRAYLERNRRVKREPALKKRVMVPLTKKTRSTDSMGSTGSTRSTRSSTSSVVKTEDWGLENWSPESTQYHSGKAERKDSPMMRRPDNLKDHIRTSVTSSHRSQHHKHAEMYALAKKLNKRERASVYLERNKRIKREPVPRNNVFKKMRSNDSMGSTGSTRSTRSSTSSAAKTEDWGLENWSLKNTQYHSAESERKDLPIRKPRSRKNPFFKTESGGKFEFPKTEEKAAALRKCHLCDFASDCEEMHTEHLMSSHVFDLAL